MQATLLDLDEVGKQAREHHSTLTTERLQTVEQLRVGEIGELHARVLHPEFSRPWAPRGRATARENASAHLALAIGEGTATSARGWLPAETLARKRDPTPRIRQAKSIGALTKIATLPRRQERLWCGVHKQTPPRLGGVAFSRCKAGRSGALAA
jgi:hypothetical protein